MKKFISILMCITMMTSMLYIATQQRETKEVNEEIIVEEPEIKYLTDEDLSKLYTCKQDIRYNNPKIVELSQQDAMLLMQIASAESGSEKLFGQMWNMRTILNRLAEGSFGDSIYEIVSAPSQFEVFSSGRYKTAEISEVTHLALAQIEGGWDETEGALYFEASSNSEESWHKKNKTFIAEIDGQLYYR